MIRLTVWGGSGEHGRSCYYIELAGKRILLDCGVKKENAGEYPLLDRNMVEQLDAVFLSHAHEDHSMAIPLLIKLGFKGKVWTTRATVQQLSGYFASWGKYVKEHGEERPYDQKHIDAIPFEYLEEKGPCGQWLPFEPNLQLRWGRSGHLIGSVWLDIEVGGERVFYSGDYSSESRLLIADSPAAGLPSGNHAFDVSIMDAAYGMDAESQAEKMDQLASYVQKIVDLNGTVLFPVPTYGRGQDLMIWAAGRFSETPIYVESELIEGLQQMLANPNWLLPGIADEILQWMQSSRFVTIRLKKEREQLLSEGIGGIVFTSDGMMQSDKAQWYYSKLKMNPCNGVILTGHLARGSFGQKLLAEQFADSDKQQAQIIAVRYKVHQGLPDVRRMLQTIRSQHTLLVHTGKTDTDLLCEKLAKEGFAGLQALIPGDSLEIR